MPTKSSNQTILCALWIRRPLFSVCLSRCLIAFLSRIQASLWFDYFRDYGKDAAVPDLGDPENDEKMQLTARDSGLVFDGEYSVLFVPILSDKYHVFVLLAAFISYGDDGVVSLTIDYYFPAIRPEVRLSRMVAAALKNVVYAFCWRVRRHNKFWRFRQSEFLPFESLGTRLNFRHHEVPVSADPNAQGLYMLYAIEALTSQSCWSTWKMLKIDEYREQVLRVAKEWAAKHR